MSIDISGVGLSARLIASQTFPVGVTLTHFTDDTDPLDITTIQQGNSEMGLNGDLITWGSAVKIPAAFAVIPGSPSWEFLAILAERNRVGRGKTSAGDSIQALISYPDGGIVTLTQGILESAPPARSVASQGRQKSMVYLFSFENKTGV